MGNYVGDYDLSKTFYHRFTTVNASGLPTTLGNTPTLQYYVDGGTTAFTAGLTLTADFNSVTGLNSVQVICTTSATGIVAGVNISVQIAAGTVSGVSLVGYPVIEYSVGNRSPLRPATAGRTLLVSSTGYAGIDWNAIGTPGATQSLSATTLFTTTNVTNTVPANVTAASTNIGAVVTASNINIGAVVTACNTIVPTRVTAQGIDVGAIVTAVNTVVPARVTSASASGLAKFFLTDSGTAYASAVAGSVVKEIADNAGGSSLSVSAIVSGVWEAKQTASGTVASSFGAFLNASITSRPAIAEFFTVNSGQTYATAVTGSVVLEVANNAGVEASGVAAVVWEAKQTANNTVSGSFGSYLDTAISSRLAPSVSGRALLVSSTGYGAIDWNAIGTPGATQNLSATTLFTTTNVTNNVGAVVTAVNTITPARVTAQGIDVGAIVTACNTVVDANVTAITTNVGAIVTASSINIGAVVTACNTVVPANVTAYSTAIAANVTAASTAVPARVTAIAATVLATIGGAVWDAVLGDHLTGGSTGEALNAAGGAGDPWITPLPGAYVTGQAGAILGDIVQSGVVAIRAKTTGLAFTVAGQVDANVKYVNDTGVTGTGASGDEWGPV